MRKSDAILALIILAFAASVLPTEEKATPHSNPADFHLSLNSQREVSYNVAAADSRFKNLAFAEPAYNETEEQLAGVWASVKNIFSWHKQEKEAGVWLWTPLMTMSPKYMLQMISGTKQEKLDVIYLSIDSYLDIYTLPDGEEKEQKKKEFSDKLESFVKMASENGLAVDAEAGWRNWAEPGHEYKPLAIASFARDYNSTHQYKLRGLQYDIEPYDLEIYKEKPAETLKNLVALVDKAREHLSDSDLRLSVVVPAFYDKEDKATPSFFYRGREDYAFGHLLSILDKKPGSSLIIMSYRNQAEGADGSIEITTNEMRTAKRHPTRIVVAQETGPVEPTFLTFHGLSKNELHTELGKINAAFNPERHFGGTAIHFANAYLAMQ